MQRRWRGVGIAATSRQRPCPTIAVTCGPAHPRGLHVFPGPVTGRSLVAALWVPPVALAGADGHLPPELVAAALDCPQLWALMVHAPPESTDRVVTAQLETRLEQPVAAGEPHVVMGWPIGRDGRRWLAGAAILGARRGAPRRLAPDRGRGRGLGRSARPRPSARGCGGVAALRTLTPPILVSDRRNGRAFRDAAPCPAPAFAGRLAGAPEAPPHRARGARARIGSPSPPRRSRRRSRSPTSCACSARSATTRSPPRSSPAARPRTSCRRSPTTSGASGRAARGSWRSPPAARRSCPRPASSTSRPALEWLRELVDTLTIVEPIVDPTMLLFESIVVSGHDEEYGRAGSEIRPALAAALQAVIPIARDVGDTIVRVVMEQMNRSSVGVQDRDADPQLAALAGRDRLAREVQRAARARAQGRSRRHRARGGGARLRGCRAGAAAGARRAQRPRDVARGRRAVLDACADPAAEPAAQRGRRHLRRLGLRRPGSRCARTARATTGAGCSSRRACSAARRSTRTCGIAFAHTDNVHDFFTYSRRPINDGRTPLSIWAEASGGACGSTTSSAGWRARGSRARALAGADIRPGDVALIRHRGAQPAGEIANHIVMVDSWDPATGKLVTIEGNVLEGIRPDAAGEPQRTADRGPRLDDDERAELDRGPRARHERPAHADARAPARAASTRSAAPGPSSASAARRWSTSSTTTSACRRSPTTSSTSRPRRCACAASAPGSRRPSTIESPQAGPYHRRVGD